MSISVYILGIGQLSGHIDDLQHTLSQNKLMFEKYCVYFSFIFLSFAELLFLVFSCFQEQEISRIFVGKFGLCYLVI